MPDADKLLVGHGCYNKPYSKGWAVYAFAGERIEDFSVLTRATTHRIKSSPAFSRDGKQIAFVSGHGTHRNIYVMNADGSNVRQLTHDYNENPQPAGKDLITMRFNGAPSFSPDGKRIIFKRSAVQRQKPKHLADPMEPSRWDIYEVEIATGRERRLTNFAFYGISEPFYLADGKRFIFSADFRTTHGPETGLTEKFHDTYRRNYGNNTIFIMDGEKNVLKPAFVNGNESSAPRVSSNDTILFTSTKKSKSRISYFYNEPFIYRDGKIRQLGESHIGLFTHAISPDGSLILYRSDRWHVVDRDGKKLKEVSIFEGSLDWLEKQKFKSSGSLPTAAKATGRSN